MIEFLVSYLFGSFPNGYLLCKKFRHIDIREYGSTSIGTTNVLRVTNSKILALSTLLLDFIKGMIVALLFKNSDYLLVDLFLVLVGHVYPIWIKFRGGKAVSTCAGIYLILEPVIAICSIAVWLIVLKISKISAIASLSLGLSFTIFNLIHYVFTKNNFNYVIFSIVTFLFLCFTHRNNIKQLCNVQNNSKLS